MKSTVRLVLLALKTGNEKLIREAVRSLLLVVMTDNLEKGGD